MEDMLIITCIDRQELLKLFLISSGHSKGSFDGRNLFHYRGVIDEKYRTVASRLWLS